MIEPPVQNLMSVEDAIDVIDADPVTPMTTTAPIADCVGRRLAVDVLADRDYPPFDKAVMDGFAIESAAAAGDERIVIDTVHAGRAADVALASGQAAAVMTGAPVPAGTVSVVPVEFVMRSGDRIRINRAVPRGQAIAAQGSDVQAGRLLIPTSTVIGPQHVAAIASVGLSDVPVYRRPRVTVLSTGDEVIPVGQTPVGPQIRNANSAMLASLLRSLGCDVQDAGIVGDDPQLLRAVIESGSTGVDALFVTGGMSMGEKDHVPRLLRDLGFDSKIAKLRIKPGKPFVFATNGDRRIFGLPGNPVSAFVCTLRLAARLLRRIGGGAAGGDLISLKLATPLPANGPREFYLPAVRQGDEVGPLNPNGSADVFTLARANSFIVRPENAPAAGLRSAVDCLSNPVG
jgi:molybdopterin molybdotransferase